MSSSIRCACFVFLCLAIAAAPIADAHKLQIFSDAALTNSSIEDNEVRIVNLYVVETGFIVATGARFSTEPGPGFTGVWLGDSSPYMTLGASPTDIAIAYGTCASPPVLALTMTYQLLGTSSPCSELRIAPPNGFPCAITPDVNCSWVEACIEDLASLHVNCPVATAPTTWGKVKALYRN